MQRCKKAEYNMTMTCSWNVALSRLVASTPTVVQPHVSRAAKEAVSPSLPPGLQPLHRSPHKFHAPTQLQPQYHQWQHAPHSPHVLEHTTRTFPQCQKPAATIEPQHLIELRSADLAVRKYGGASPTSQKRFTLLNLTGEPPCFSASRLLLSGCPVVPAAAAET